MTKIRSKAIEWGNKLNNVITACLYSLHIYQIGSINCKIFSREINQVSSYMCKNHDFLCKRSDLLFDSYKNNYGFGFDISNSGMGVKHAAHFAQLINGDNYGQAAFRKFDYGKEKN